MGAPSRHAAWRRVGVRPEYRHDEFPVSLSAESRTTAITPPRRPRAVAKLTLAAAALALASPAAGLGANPGGTPPGGASAPTSGAAPSAPTAPTPSKATPARITDARCVPYNACSTNPHQVSIRGRLVFSGSGLASGMAVAFPNRPGARISSHSPTSHLHHSALGLVASVPSTAHSGHIEILLGRGRTTAPWGPILVARHALHPPRTPHQVTPLAPVAGSADATAFNGQGMWIWYLSKSDGGSIPAIVAQAQQAGVSTVFVKSSDGSTNYWSQFSSALVAQMHANGIHVCAWQYVYGTHPTAEADLGAQAVAAGADCLVIDAESEYEGHYGAAQSYITELRAKVGPNYPVGLASFPYVDYHPSEPYSVFLGPGGAQFNLPQMYWQDIGTSVDNVYSHTFIANRIYGRPIYPLGQTFQDPPPSAIERFRQLAGAYGSPGVSWWDWQETTARGWAALAATLPPLTGFTATTAEPVLAQGAKGDQVLWMQEHLAAAEPAQPTSGIFDSQTTTDLETFQSQNSIPPSGKTDAPTWAALLALTPVPVDWTSGGPSASSSRVRPGGVRVARAPASARLHALRYEIPRHGLPGGAPAHRR